MKIGFIGLGIMGKPMVKNFLKEQNTVLVNDVNKDTEQEMVKEGAQSASITEMAQEVDYLFLSLPNGAIVKSVLYSGQDAILN